MSLADRLIEFARVVASEILGDNAAVTLNLVGIGGLDADGTGLSLSDDDGEQAPQMPAYGALGVVSRPLDPDDDDNFCEAVSARTSDGLEPFAYRDLRINRALNPTGENNAPAKGQTGIAGYGGAYFSHRHDRASRTDMSILYVPYDFDGDGVPQKSHAIIIDPTDGNSSIQIIHGDGVFLNLQDDVGGGSPGILAAVNAATFLKISAGELTLQAERIMLKGNCYLGRSAETGLPLLAGAASPASPSVFVSPV